VNIEKILCIVLFIFAKMAAEWMPAISDMTVDDVYKLHLCGLNECSQ